jgi:ABC-type transporter Mla MlaB component
VLPFLTESRLTSRVPHAVFATQPVREALLNKYIPRAQSAAAEKGDVIKYIVIDLAPVTDIDATSVRFLLDFVRLTTEQGIQTVLTNPSRRVVRALVRAEIPQLIGEGAPPPHAQRVISGTKRVALRVHWD